MKRKRLYSVFYTAFVAAALASCNDYDAAYTAYEDIENEVTAITPPDIDPAWNLELIANVGQHETTVFVYKDKKYDGLFTRTLGWNGGAGAQSVLLPDGNVFWTFDDSYFGVVDAGTRARGECNIVSNSVMIQTASTAGEPGETSENLEWQTEYIQTENPGQEGYYQAQSAFQTPSTVASDESAAVFYQTNDAAIVEKDGKNVLQMLWASMDNSGGTAKRTGTCLVTYSLEGRQGEDGYLAVDEKVENFNTDAAGYGTTVWEDADGYIYLYTSESGRPLVARVAGSLSEEWEYYVRDVYGNFQWQATYPTEDERKISGIMENNYIGLRPYIFKKGDWYYMIMQATSTNVTYGHAVNIYRSESPCGPFTDQKTLFNVPYTIDKFGSQHYDTVKTINLHEELSREGELVISVNTSVNTDADNYTYPGSADFTRPYFFRVFNWESLYADDGGDTAMEDENQVK